MGHPGCLAPAGCGGCSERPAQRLRRVCPGCSKGTTGALPPQAGPRPPDRGRCLPPAPSARLWCCLLGDALELQLRSRLHSHGPGRQSGQLARPLPAWPPGAGGPGPSPERTESSHAVPEEQPEPALGSFHSCVACSSPGSVTEIEGGRGFAGDRHSPEQDVPQQP